MMHMPPEHPTTHPSPITKSLSLSQIVRFETEPPVLHQTRQTKTEFFIAKSWFSSLLSKLLVGEHHAWQCLEMCHSIAGDMAFVP